MSTVCLGICSVEHITRKKRSKSDRCFSFGFYDDAAGLQSTVPPVLFEFTQCACVVGVQRSHADSKDNLHMCSARAFGVGLQRRQRIMYYVRRPNGFCAIRLRAAR